MQGSSKRLIDLLRFDALAWAASRKSYFSLCRIGRARVKAVVSGGTLRPSAQQSISVWRRRSRVSSRLALITQWVAVRR